MLSPHVPTYDVQHAEEALLPSELPLEDLLSSSGIHPHRGGWQLSDVVMSISAWEPVRKQDRGGGRCIAAALPWT